MPTKLVRDVHREARRAVSAPGAEPALAFITLALCIGIVGYKTLLAWRLNVNWDEFYFLNHVYALTRGELTLLMQGAYTHLFTWLTRIPGDEVGQVVAGRLVMVALLGLTAWLVWRLARLWLKGLAAALPPFVFLTSLPVLEHGGSFRADSLLTPLCVAALLVLFSPSRTARRDWVAGALLGIAFAATVKVVLFAPLFVFASFHQGSARESSPGLKWAAVAATMVRVGIAATVTATALISLHALSVDPRQTQSITTFAASTAGTAVLETPWFPRLAYLIRYYEWQPLPWILIAVGAILAVARRRFHIAALSLSLLPLAFYRNAFPYYYVVMLAPASILVGWAVAEISAIVRRHSSAAVTLSLVAVLWLGTVFNGLRYLDRLGLDDQRVQRAVIAGVHEIFTEPVSYIDRCGMVSSFRKANFFMSTWGLNDYRDRNTAIMAATFAAHQPRFVLVNAPALDPAYASEDGLLAEDQELLRKHYVEYWGPVRVAGADATLEGSVPVRVTVPFAERYRLITSEPVMIGGHLHSDGDVIEVAAQSVELARTGASPAGATRVRLVIASAKPAPANAPPPFPIFKNL